MNFILKHWLILLFLLIPAPVFCQDTIIAINGDEFSGKIIEITLEEVLVIKEGIKSSYPLKKVFLIKFENGTKEVYPEHLNASFEVGNLSKEELVRMGKTDADKFHSGKEPFYLTGGGTLLCMPAGCGMLLSYALTKPKPLKNQTSHPELLNDPHYRKAYSEQARRHKSKMALKGFVFSIGIQAALVVGIMYFSTLQ